MRIGSFVAVDYEHNNEYYLFCLLKLLIEGYETNLKICFDSFETCYVFNDSNAECPMFIVNEGMNKIRLAQDDLSYWAQTIYQLSHEMCHYIFRHYKKDKDITLRWYEETVCEAISLYFLDYASKAWNKCELSNMNPHFYQSISDYLKNEIGKNPTNDFKICTNIDLLKEYEFNNVYERKTRYAERNYLYKELLSNKDDFHVLLNYTNYLNGDGLSFAFDNWERDYSSDLIMAIKDIQPIKS